MDPSLFSFFGFGLFVGLLVCFYVWFRGLQERKRLSTELSKLRNHLDAHIELSHEGTAQRKAEVESLRKHNENLRVTLKAWQQKPDRRELRQLHVYDHAVRDLMRNAPGFAPHWENAVQKAETVIAEEDRGLLAFARRLILPTRKGTPPDETS
jgi:hypothetical protein